MGWVDKAVAVRGLCKQLNRPRSAPEEREMGRRRGRSVHDGWGGETGQSVASSRAEIRMNLDAPRLAGDGICVGVGRPF